MANNSSTTKKGTLPLATRVATKHKRVEYGRELKARADKRRARRRENDQDWCKRNRVEFIPDLKLEADSPELVRDIRQAAACANFGKPGKS